MRTVPLLYTFHSKPKGPLQAWPFYRTSFGVRLCWELEEPEGPGGNRSTTFLIGILSHAPPEHHPLAHRREPSTMKGWVLEILCCDPKGSRASLRILSTEG